MMNSDSNFTNPVVLSAKDADATPATSGLVVRAGQMNTGTSCLFAESTTRNNTSSAGLRSPKSFGMSKIGLSRKAGKWGRSK